MKAAFRCAALCLAATTLLAREWHVSPAGRTGADGSAARPFAAIGAAAEVAQPGDTITVHAGTYRERVNPPRGGESDARRIVYQAAPGEAVVITGSEIARGWQPFKPGVWKLTLPNSFFGKFNPYQERIAGDWFNDKGRPHHPGAVYLNGRALWETHLLERVLQPRPLPDVRDREGSTWTWFAECDAQHTYLYANFHDRNPNEELVEINVRRTVFYPDKPGVNFLTVRGFTLRHAATPWAPPTAEQVGLIGTHWSRGWIIERNIISDSRCSGLTLGKYGDEFDNTSANTAEGYVKTVERALARGWDRTTVGGHVVRHNTIFNCEQTGICGSLGAIFSEISHNHIFDIWTQRQFAGAEMAGIKLHAAIDVTLAHNRVHRAGRGVWLDWMAQGTRVTANLCYDNSTDDLFVEVNHGPFVVDDNCFLSATNLRDWSEGGAFVHNLFTGKIETRPEPKRATPYHPAHATAVAGLAPIKGGDHRFYNNVFVGAGALPAGSSPRDSKNPGRANGFGLWVYDQAALPVRTAGNLYFRGARPGAGESATIAPPDFDPAVSIAEETSGGVLHFSPGPASATVATTLVTTALLGRAAIPDLSFENADGTPLKIDTDYRGATRPATRPTPGPFEHHSDGPISVQF